MQGCPDAVSLVQERHHCSKGDFNQLRDAAYGFQVGAAQHKEGL